MKIFRRQRWCKILRCACCKEDSAKEDDENTCLQKSVDTLITVVRIVRRTRKTYEYFYETSEETTFSFIAETVNKVVETFLQSMSLSDTLGFWQFLDDPYRVNSVSSHNSYTSQFLIFTLLSFNFCKRTLTTFYKYRTMNTLKYIRLREEGSLNERTFKRAIVQKCDWAYEDFQTAEMVQDSTMRTLQGRFRKEDDKNTCLRKSVDTLINVVRIVRRAREMYKLRCAKLCVESDEAALLKIAELANRTVEKQLQSMSLSEALEFWRFLEDSSRENGASTQNHLSQIFWNICFFLNISVCFSE
ncbi:hypothetical protein CEXT_432191 [Caerostris extrusa]|uniref:Uncharacterized protein n=1 Tax=Caerostris extrusa TaxID=172846 RepID=A0AAV4M6V5_CAEEX|nr:hypothetical protein CEXT_432191 [Caerostris extrusa]